ncbi:MAG: GDSL-type esterase/lipase family protein [Victivallales bacterium]|jgi:lysophospholipase L1-like esterase
MKIIFTVVIAVAVLAACSFAGAADVKNPDNPACVPEKRTDWSEPVTKMWIDKAAKQKAADGSIDILFLGDSITQLWMNDKRWPNGQAVWDKNYKPLKALNFGIAADRTEHLIWRIGEGKMIEGLTPKITVLLIGVNNLTNWGGRPGGDTPENLAAAVVLILDSLKKQMPDSKILLLGIFPAFEKSDAPIREKIRKTNKLISAQADFKKVFYLDIGDKFLAPDGKADKEIIRDGVHLSEKGYEIWAENMNPYLLDLLNNNGNGKIWETLKVK